MKKLLSIALALCLARALAAPAMADGTVKIGMVTDVGGVNDNSFNQTSWEGLVALAAEDASFEVNYLESKTDADYQTNINTFIDEGYDLIICVGYMLADATRGANMNALGRRCASTVFIMIVSGLILYLVYGVGSRDLGERLDAKKRWRDRFDKLTGKSKKGMKA